MSLSVDAFDADVQYSSERQLGRRGGLLLAVIALYTIRRVDGEGGLQGGGI